MEADDNDHHLHGEEQYFVQMTAARSFMHKSQHMLGSFSMRTVNRWAPSSKSLVQVRTVPALITIIDELVSNAFDNHIKSCEAGFKSYTVQVDVDEQNNSVSVRSTGKGITANTHGGDPVAVKVFEAINFSDAYSEGRGNAYRAGQLGGGAKLANMWSSRFRMETCNGKEVVKAEWVCTDGHFEDLQRRRQWCTIDKCAGCGEGTTITMYPNLEAFSINSLQDASVTQMMENRCYALQAHVGKPNGISDNRKLAPYLNDIAVSVWFNGKKLDYNNGVGSMKDLARCFVKQTSKEPPIAAYRDPEEGIDMAIFKPDEEWKADEDLYVVNGVNALSGGAFLERIRAQVVRLFADEKDGLKTKLGSQAVHVDDQYRRNALEGKVVVFMSCAVLDVSFDADNKSYATNTDDDYCLDAGDCEPMTRHQLMQKLSKSISLKNMLDQELKTKEQKRNASVKTVMPKELIDATDVGQKSARKLTLLLVEGDSAKPIAQRIQRKNGEHLYGVYPVSGKLPNPRNRKGKHQRSTTRRS